MNDLIVNKILNYTEEIFVYTFVFHHHFDENDLRDVSVINIIAKSERGAVEKLLDTIDYNILRFIYTKKNTYWYWDESLQERFDKIYKEYISITDDDGIDLGDDEGLVGGKLDKFYQKHRGDFITLLCSSENDFHLEIIETPVKFNFNQ